MKTLSMILLVYLWSLSLFSFGRWRYVRLAEKGIHYNFLQNISLHIYQKISGIIIIIIIITHFPHIKNSKISTFSNTGFL